MKKKLILLGVVCIMILSWYISNTNKEPPPVAFSYLYQNSYYRSVWVIDQQGSIYRFHDNATLAMEDYENRKQSENCQYIKTIDMKIVEEKYDFLKNIIADNHYKKNTFKKSEIGLGELRGTTRWYGYIYNWKGEEEEITLHDDGDLRYWSEDVRMKELADSLTDLIKEEIREYDECCYQLKLEEVIRDECGY